MYSDNVHAVTQWSLSVRLDGVSQSSASGLLEDNDNCNSVRPLKPGFPLFACLSTAFFADRRPIRYQREGTSVFIRMEKISPNVVNHEGHRSTNTCSCPRVKKIWIQVSVSLWRLDRVQHLPSTGAFLPLCVEQKLEMCQEQCLIKLQLTLLLLFWRRWGGKKITLDASCINTVILVAPSQNGVCHRVVFFVLHLSRDSNHPEHFLSSLPHISTSLPRGSVDTKQIFSR